MMRRTIALIAALLAMPAAPSFAGDPAGVDPQMMQACVDAAKTEGGIVDCAGTGVDKCKAMWAERKPDMNPFDVLNGCTDAERQAWEALLTEQYDGLIADVQQSRPEEVETMRAMERSWLAFRDARCAAERGLFGHGTGGAIAVPNCLMKETARQVALLIQLRKDE